MRAWRDSANPPTDAELAAAKAAGIQGWCGYFKFDAAGNVVVGTVLENDHVYVGWSDADFERVLRYMDALAFCSGGDNPAWCKARAARLGIQPWLDDESGMRAVGGWEQAWVNAAGAGLYGNAGVHVGVTAPLGHIFAGYYNYNPNATWPSWIAKPNGPLGWQWQGTHLEFGISDDSDWFDDAIGQRTLAGGGGGSITGDDEDLLYTSAIHPFATSLKAYAAGSYYQEPFTSLPAAGGVTVDAVYPVDGYCWSSSPVHATTPPEADSVWWHVKTGGWVPDALLDTSAMTGPPVPVFPAAEAIVRIYDLASGRYIPLGGGGGLSADQVNQAIAAALAKLPAAGLSKDQVDQELAAEIAKLTATTTLKLSA